MSRLSSTSTFPREVRTPTYKRTRHGAGIVHFGISPLHRALQAVATDDALAAYGGDWRIIGVSPHNPHIAEALNAQDGLFTVLERTATGTRTRIIGSIAHAIAASRHPADVLTALARPSTRIVSTTIGATAYGLDRTTGGIDSTRDFIAADLANPRHPTSTIGMIVEGLRLRRQANLPPYTLMCCDPLPDNGNMLRRAVLEYAQWTQPDLADWIEAEVAFPATIIDRFTLPSSAKTLSDAHALTGHADFAPVEAESFSQWIIEDNFSGGRPAWEKGGALLVVDIAPYEQMKLRMVNGTHTLLAHAGFLAGHPHLHDTMGFAPLTQLAKAHLKSTAKTLDPLPGIDLSAYADALITRFANPAITHQTFPLAMDSTEKLPTCIFAPAAKALANTSDIRTFAFATAAWMRYCLGHDDAGHPYDLHDPRQHELTSAVSGHTDNINAIANSLESLHDLCPPTLSSTPRWRDAVRHYLKIMIDKDMTTAIETIAAELA